jgi:hypothetical protein
LPDPVIHRRKVLLDGQAHKVSVLDELLGAGNHHADIYFHLAEGCDLRSSGQGSYLAIWPWGGIEIVMDPVWSMEVIKGGTGPILGWMSRSYHCKRAIYTLVGSCSWRDQLNSIVLINTK